MRWLGVILAVVWGSWTPMAIAADQIRGTQGSVISVEPIASFRAPWAVTRLDAQTLLVTEKLGKLWRVSETGEKTRITGVPNVDAQGQGGLGDIVPHPEFATNNLIYLSYATSFDGGKTRGAVVARAILVENRLVDVTPIWQQTPFTSGAGHYGHRLHFGQRASNGKYELFITSGDRQKMTPAQDIGGSLGKVLRLFDDGTVPDDNPLSGRGDAIDGLWTWGHRNPLGIDIDDAGRVWSVEMGPRDGDELNLITGGQNYGWPLVSEGDHYSGQPIPTHDTDRRFAAPVISWVPTLAPSDISILPRDAGQWAGNAFVTGLRGQALVRIAGLGDHNTQERFDFGARLRGVLAEAEDQIWIITDGAQGRLLRVGRVE